MQYLDKDQTAFLIDNLFYILEVNNVPKNRDEETSFKVMELGNKLLALIGITQHSELCEDAHNIMDKVYLSWINTQD